MIDDFGLAARGARVEPAMAPPDKPASLKLDTLERDAVAAALDKVQGNISRAARLLGVSRAALYRKLDKHGL